MFALALPAHANGGGYFRGGVERAGDIAGFEPKATENIRILDEKLTIKFGQEEAGVEVRYLMKNVTAKKVKVRFGFPVEESFDRSYYDKQKDKKSAARRELAYCKDYQITAAGQPVKATWKGEANETHDKRFMGIAGWMVSEITFAPNEEKPLRIRFQSVYPQEEWSVSDNGSRSAAVFRYRLSTAACWNGTIGSGSVEIRPQGIDPSWMRAIKPVNRFRWEDGSLVWNFENLEPTLADDLEIEALPTVHSYWGGDTVDGEVGIEYFERRGQWSMAHSNYRVKASSTLAPDKDHKYHAENIRVVHGEEVWSEGAKGPGIGEWLELEPIVQKPLEAITIRPGYAFSQERFEANARPKRMAVELNGSHRFTVDVPDSREEFRIAVSNYTKPVKKIRLTFEEVWPGSRFEDLCVTGVRLHVHLDKKPKIQQAR